VLEENGKTLYDGIADNVLRLDVYPKRAATIQFVSVMPILHRR
jgi:hypothetical protein